MPQLESEREACSPIASALLWAALVVSCLAASAHFNALAPCGRWLNAVFGAELWYENDPSGSYIASAHELLSAPSPLFPGHPGTPLQLGLLGVQGAYFTAVAPDGMGFTEFTARHIDRVHELSKLFATALHLASFFAVYAFAARLLSSRRAARFATFAYATSFPVLYFLSRVSVEPLMVLFFCTTVLAVWRAQREYERGASGAAWCALAGVLAASGLVTKLHFLGPLPGFAMLVLFVGTKAPRRERIRAVLAVLVGTAVALAAWSFVIDWGELADKWLRVGQIRGSGRRYESFWPGATPGGLFLLCELLLVVLGTIGLVRSLRNRPERRAATLWVSLYVLFSLAIWGYRVIARGGDFRCFHYLFFFVMWLAVFAGDLTNDAFARFGARARIAASGLWLVLLHGVALASLVETRAYDGEQFARIADVHALVRSLEPDETIALTTRPGFFKLNRLLVGIDKGGSNIHGLSTRYAPDARTSALAAAYSELFVRMDKRDVPADARTGELEEFGPFAVLSP